MPLEEPQASPLDRLEAVLGESWPAIRAARGAALEQKRRIAEALAPFAMQDASIVVFGSLARNEVTRGSDVDWTLLVDGQASPAHQDVSLDIGERLAALGLVPPGPEGTFGGLAPSHDLIHKIGGGGDTNRNLTQRILLLLESEAFGNAEAHGRVVREVLKRYIGEDFDWRHKTGPFNVPRLLQNDVARYWRTVAVDFAYKRRQRHGEGWALRAVKLRMSRKLTYVAGLLVCFSFALERADRPDRLEGPDSDLVQLLLDHLSRIVGQPPLELVAGVLLKYETLHDAARALFTSYDRFLTMLDDPEARRHLTELAPSAAASDALYQEARETGHRFQDALTRIFLEPNGTLLYELTKTYGVF